MTTMTLQEFQDATALLPHVVADNICDDSAFKEWAAERTLHLFNVDPTFRRLLGKSDSRDWLYSFMHHWWDAWQLRGGPPR